VLLAAVFDIGLDSAVAEAAVVVVAHLPILVNKFKSAAKL
jgi:hypothetical protein